MPKYFRFPFARSGDKTAVPDAVVPAGDVSYDQGYGPYYQLPKTNPLAKDIERDKMNQVLNDITDAVRYVQELGVSAWIANADNGGVAFPYAKGARVMYTDGKIYVSQKAANTSLPTVTADWFEDSGRLLRTLVFLRIGGVQNVIIDGAAPTPTGAGTYTPSAGMKFIIAEAQGGGNPGGGSLTTTTGNISGGSAGGAGAYGKGRYSAASVGASQPITVGAAGTQNLGAAGGVGGTSSIGALLSAPGGLGSLSQNGIPSGQIIIGNNSLTAAPSGANLISIKGGCNNSSLCVTNGSVSGFLGGTGGFTPFGVGGAGTSLNAPASPASGNYGTGGGGTFLSQSSPSVTGGAATDGVVIIQEFGG